MTPLPSTTQQRRASTNSQLRNSRHSWNFTYGGVPDALDALNADAERIRRLFEDFQRYLYLEPVAS
jgi:hypothetical protein